MAVLDTILWGNPVQRWLIALALGLIAYGLVRLALRVVRGRLGALAERTRTEWDDLVIHALGRTRRLFVLAVALYAGGNALVLPARIWDVIQIATVLIVLIQIGIWVSSALTFGLERYTRKQLDHDRGAATTVSAMGFVGKLIVWSLVLLVALDNIGVDVTALVAGLGIGGIAVALALQNVLGDLFASLSIVLDKPFVLGDFVIVGDHLGSIEHIGLKTTRIRSLWGEQVVFSNSDLLGSRLRNFGRMAERRVVFSIGVVYQTPRSQLELIPAIIREAIEEQERTRFDRSHLKEFGDFSINFESVYFVLAPDYNVYMDVHQAINLRIHQRFEEEGIEFAYPTQTLFLAGQSVGAGERGSVRA